MRCLAAAIVTVALLAGSALGDMGLIHHASDRSSWDVLATLAVAGFAALVILDGRRRG